jgi:iron complex transport system permease protein
VTAAVDRQPRRLAWRRPVSLAALGLAVTVVSLAALALGAVRIAPGEVWATLWGGEETRFATVVWQLRLPRLLLALLVGSSLAVAGALMQGLFRNPLADPALVGASSGGALGAVFVLVLANQWLPGVPLLSDLRLLPLAAFLGALAVTGLVLRIATTGGYTAVATLLLVGVAVNALTNALIGLATFLATEAQLRSLSFWTLGSLGAADWNVVGLAAPLCLLLVLAAPWFAGALNALALGEAEAGHLGYRVQTLKTVLVILTAAGVGASVAFTGIILFVGLVVPHLMRLLVGPDHRWLLPACALSGAAILAGSDTLARTVLAPAELPIGLVTAGFGAPCFLYLLLRQQRHLLLP